VRRSWGSKRLAAPGAAAAGAIALGAAAWPGRADAEPLRLRADAYAEARSPVGLIVLQGESRERPWLAFEGLVWSGYRDGGAADVLVLMAKLREARGYGELRVGRFVVATGAVRPMHLDGAWGVVRSPQGSTAEAFAGVPVVPRFGGRAYDWAAGGRVAQTIAARVTAGVSYVQERDRGASANEEVGFDLAAAPTRRIDLAARGAYDLSSPGVTDALVSAAWRSTALRVELFGTHRSPSRILPATSLFSVLGDLPSQQAGATARWGAAPRLDLSASGAAQRAGGQLGARAWVRGELRLDDRGEARVGLEVRRQDVGDARWSGVRASGAQGLGKGLTLSSELELARPDEPRGRGALWPWGLLALAWRSAGGAWEVAAACEAAVTPESRAETNALVRLAHRLEGK
jgi:hypothetical protein